MIAVIGYAVVVHVFGCFHQKCNFSVFERLLVDLRFAVFVFPIMYCVLCGVETETT